MHTAQRARVLTRLLFLLLALCLAGVLRVPAAAQTLTHTSTSPLPAGSITVPYSFIFTAIGGTPGYTWAITGGVVPNLTLNAATGELSGTPLTSGVFQITVTVTDSTGSSRLKDFIVPINSGPLEITTVSPVPAGIVGNLYSTTLTAQGGAGPRTFSVSGGTLPTGLTLSSGGILSGLPTLAGRFFFDARVQDFFSSQATKTLSALMIGCPAGSAAANSPYSSAVQIGQVPADTTFGISSGALPNGLSLNPTTGAVTGIPTQTGVFAITYRINEPSFQSTWFASCSLTVAPAVTLACPATSGTVGSPYSSSVVAGGGFPPYSNFGLAVGSGPLPPGLTINATGAIAGTPTQSGNFPVVFTVRDSLNHTTTSSCSINISPRAPSLACPATNAQVGSPYQSALVPSGAPPFSNFTVNAGSLPPGLQLNPATGLVFGSPTRHGTFQTGFAMRDANNAQATTGCTFTVTPAPLLLGCPSGFANAGAAYGSAVAGIGGVAPYTFALVTGALPAGLNFSPATGAIAGLPDAPGDFPLRFRVTDSTQATAESDCRIAVDAPATNLRVVASCSNIPFPTGSTIRIPLNATGGAGGYSFRILSPAWMRLEDNQGLFSAVGTPPGPGGFTISVAVIDDEQKQATFNCSIRVLPPLDLIANCPGAPIPVGTQLAIPMSIQGGQPPYTWRLSGPEWLKLAAQYGSVNELFGTPPAPGNVSFTVTLTDSINSRTATFSCNIIVAAANLLITATPGCPVSRLTALQQFQQSFAASGGGDNFSWSLSGPPWLSLSRTAGAATSIAGTLPESGGMFPFTLTLRDAGGTASTSFSCELDTIPALSIRGALPAFFTQGQSFSINLEGVGGQPPYRWSVNGPGFVSLNPNTGSLVVLGGTPPATDPFSCSVTLSDDAGSVPATFNCSAPVRLPVLRVDPPSGSCPATPILLGQPFSTTLRALGGDGNYRWSFQGPSWLSASPLTGPSVTVSGTPDQPGTFNFEVALADGLGPAVEPFRCNLVVDLPAIPTISIVGLALGGDVLQEVTVGLQLAAPAPIRLEAEVELSFVSAGFGATDNPQVQFVEPGATAGGRRFRFIILAGQTTTSLARIRPGTVTGTIRVRLVSVIAAGREVLGPNSPAREAVVPRLRPFITDFQFANESETGFALVVTGYSTPREMISGLVTFTARQGATLSGATSFTVQLADFFRTYYSGAASQIGGSTFVLRIPVTVEGTKNDIGAVSVRLTNSVGDSDVATRSR